MKKSTQQLLMLALAGWGGWWLWREAQHRQAVKDFGTPQNIQRFDFDPGT